VTSPWPIKHSVIGEGDGDGNSMTVSVDIMVVINVGSSGMVSVRIVWKGVGNGGFELYLKSLKSSFAFSTHALKS